MGNPIIYRFSLDELEAREADHERRVRVYSSGKTIKASFHN